MARLKKKKGVYHIVASFYTINKLLHYWEIIMEVVEMSYTDNKQENSKYVPE